MSNITPLTPPGKDQDTATLAAILSHFPPDDQSVLIWRTAYHTIYHNERGLELPCSASLRVAFDGSIELQVYWPHMSVRMAGHHSLMDIAAFLGLPRLDQEWTRDTQEEQRVVGQFKQQQEEEQRKASRVQLSAPGGVLADRARNHR